MNHQRDKEQINRGKRLTVQVSLQIYLKDIFLIGREEGEENSAECHKNQTGICLAIGRVSYQQK